MHATLNDMGRCVGCYLVQQGGAWAGPQPAQAFLAVPNVTAHPSTASVPITVLLMVRCSFAYPSIEEES